MIICKRSFHLDDHLQKADPSRWSFARGWFIQMIICKRLVDQDDHFKRLVHPNNHLQEVVLSWWSFAKGRSIQMIICKRLIHTDHHLQEAGPSGWSFVFVVIYCLLLIIVCRLSLFVSKSGISVGLFHRASKCWASIVIQNIWLSGCLMYTFLHMIE